MAGQNYTERILGSRILKIDVETPEDSTTSYRNRSRRVQDNGGAYA